MHRAVLDDKGRLIGREAVKSLKNGEIDPGDLPMDGSYKWSKDHSAFLPLGTGFGKVKGGAPYSTEHVLFAMIKSAGTDVPGPAQEWAAWFEATMAEREETRP